MNESADAWRADLRDQQSRRDVVQRRDLDHLAIIERTPTKQSFTMLIETYAPTQRLAVGLDPQQVRILLGGYTANVGTVTYEGKYARHRYQIIARQRAAMADQVESFF